MKYKVDNVKNYEKTRWWIMGHFIPGILNSKDVEVKYHRLRKTKKRLDGVHYHSIGKEIVIVAKGKVKWLIEGKEIITKEGDFIVMKNNVREVVTEVLEPSVVITIRTPSIKGNKIYV